MSQNSNASHHLEIRKRIYQKLEKFPHPDFYKRMIDKLVYVAGILSPLFTFPQVLKIWLNKSALDVSIYTWVTYLFVSLTWLSYGMIHKEKPIIFLNAGLVIVNFLVVLGIIFYG